MQELLRNGIDANITIQKLKEGTPANVTGVTYLGTEQFPYGFEANGTVNEGAVAVTNDTYV